MTVKVNLTLTLTAGDRISGSRKSLTGKPLVSSEEVSAAAGTEQLNKMMSSKFKSSYTCGCEVKLPMTFPSLRRYLLLLALCTGLTVTRSTERPEASTHCGPVEGVCKDGIAVFNGIPYAKPPVDERRWRPTEMLEKNDGCWQGTLDASKLGNICMQYGDSSGAGAPTGSEDCLFINIMTSHKLSNCSESKSDSELLPVAVWIHGGYLIFGSGGEPAGYTPSPSFVKNTGVVSVSFNYRLNAFGFLALNVLNEGFGAGNYGFFDQIAALKWIQANIAAFGGDKNRVTVYGQSSGGTSIVALLASPLSRGLFQRAVMMSASTTMNNTLEDANTANQVFLKESGCKTAACLRGLSALKVLSLSPMNVYPYWAGGDSMELPTRGVTVGPLAIVDGVFLNETSLESVARGHGNDVPVIVGTTGQEVDYSPPYNIRNTTWDKYDTIVRKQMDTFQDDPTNVHTNVYEEVSRIYPHNMSTPSSGGTCVTGTPEYLMTSMASDIRVTCPNILLAQHYGRHFKSPVYSYVMVQCPSPDIQAQYGAHYAYHMMDLDALFNFTFAPNPLVRPGKVEWGLVTVMQRWFSSFCHGKSPDPQWKSVEYGTFALFYEPRMLQDLYHKEQCDFFNAHGFPPYRWQN